MLFYYLEECCTGSLIFLMLIWLITGYTFVVNRRRLTTDPKKQDYDPLAILIAPFTAPFFFMGALVVFVVRALLFTVFIIFFTIILVAVREPFIFRLWDKFAIWIGDPLLKLNTALIRMAFRPWNPTPRPPQL